MAASPAADIPPLSSQERYSSDDVAQDLPPAISDQEPVPPSTVNGGEDSAGGALQERNDDYRLSEPPPSGKPGSAYREKQVKVLTISLLVLLWLRPGSEG